jgi:hypothetical protein
VSEHLPELLDAKHLQAELGITRAAAEVIMRQLPIVTIEGLRKIYVRRADVLDLIENADLYEGRGFALISLARQRLR